jgi:predicted phosphodiesterase
LVPQAAIELLEKGIEANNTDRFRRGNLIRLPAYGDLIITGDIHGHRRNFERILTFAKLESHPDRHVIFQEIIHGGPEDEQGGCLSFELLFELARYKLDFPDRVHIVMGNHDTAFIDQSEVMKNGKEMNAAMCSALSRRFGPDSKAVELAIRRFLFSQPLAVRCENRLWISHSLPGNRYLHKFDDDIFDRELKINDVVKPSSAYLLTWGRKHSQKTLSEMARRLDVDFFVLGHQPQEQGWLRAGKNLLIIASDHNHGVLLKVDLIELYSLDLLVNAIIPLASIV